MRELKVRDVLTGVFDEASEDSSYLNTLREMREAFGGTVAARSHVIFFHAQPSSPTSTDKHDQVRKPLGVARQDIQTDESQ